MATSSAALIVLVLQHKSRVSSSVGNIGLQMSTNRDEEDADITAQLRELTDRLRGARTELVQSLRHSPTHLPPKRDRPPLPDKDFAR
ncbi:MAG: hypothetical protein ABI039_10440 [Vicinamibacterales bacterium]